METCDRQADELAPEIGIEPQPSSRPLNSTEAWAAHLAGCTLEIRFQSIAEPLRKIGSIVDLLLDDFRNYPSKHRFHIR